MRKPVAVALVAAVVVLLGVTAVLFQRYRTTTVQYTETKAAQEQAQGQYAEAFNAIAEIQDSLNAIAIGDTTQRLLSRELSGEQRLTEPQKRSALERISQLRESLERNKTRIRQLDASLHKSGVKVAGLQKMIANLKLDVAGKEQMLTEYTGRIDSLTTRVAGLETEVQENQDTIRVKDQTIELKRQDLATIYYLIGSKETLKKSGVIEAKGGVVGLGKTIKLSGHYDASLFTPLDTDQNTVVPTNAAKVQVLSAQPAGSYEVVAVAGQTEIHILDPNEFRKVKHLVVMTR